MRTGRCRSFDSNYLRAKRWLSRCNTSTQKLKETTELIVQNVDSRWLLSKILEMFWNKMWMVQESALAGTAQRDSWKTAPGSSLHRGLATTDDCFIDKCACKSIPFRLCFNTVRIIWFHEQNLRYSGGISLNSKGLYIDDQNCPQLVYRTKLSISCVVVPKALYTIVQVNLNEDPLMTECLVYFLTPGTTVQCHLPNISFWKVLGLANSLQCFT